MGKKIVIVDDSAIMRKMVRNLLNSTEHQIAGEAKNGKEAIELYKSLRPDVVVMDVTMRDMDGFTAAREIVDFDTDARIIFFSNLDKEQYSTQASDLGALGFVNKHNIDELLQLL